MLADVVVADLKRIYGAMPLGRSRYRARLAYDDIQRWSTLTGEPRATLYDDIALYLARGFHNSELSFEFCDVVVNDFFGAVLAFHDELPDLFWQVYLAFDEGEYFHKAWPDADPVEAFTRPLIARIIDGCK